jgi:hypothetical protein
MGKKAARLRKAIAARKTTRTISTLIGLTAFLEQITVKDRDQYSNLPMMNKAMAVVNNVTGRIFNFNLFNGVPKFSQQINPAGIANKWTGIGIALIGLAMVNKMIIKPVTGKGIPMLSKISSLAKYILPAGIIGGAFDQPATTGTQHGSMSYNYNTNRLMESTT